MPIYGNLVEITLENESFESIFNEFDTSIIYESDENGKSIMDRIKSLLNAFIQFLKKIKIKIMQFFNKHFRLFRNKLGKLKKEEDRMKKSEDKNNYDNNDDLEEVEINYKNYKSAINQLSQKLDSFYSYETNYDIETFFKMMSLSARGDEYYSQEIDKMFLSLYNSDFGFSLNEYSAQNIKNAMNEYFESIEKICEEIKTRRYSKLFIKKKDLL